MQKINSSVIADRRERKEENSDRYDQLVWDSEIIGEVMEVNARKYKNKVFVYYGETGQSITYGEFHNSVRNIANNLISNGLRKGDRVSVFLTNPLICLYAMHAIWKIGAIYCPINVQYKGSLLSYQINDTDPSLIITDSALFKNISEFEEFTGIPYVVYCPKRGDHDYLGEFEFSGSGAKIVTFDELFSVTSGDLTTPLSHLDMSNIIYTSGTTGPAKGVVQTHRFMNIFTYAMRSIGSSDDIVYSDVPLYHVGAVCFNINRAIWLGAQVALWDRFSSSKFWQRINSSGATVATLMDVMIPRLLNQAPQPDDKEHNLRMVNMQPLPVYMREFTRRFGVEFITCGFGQTESPISLFSVIEGLPPEDRRPAEKGLSSDEIKRRCEEIGYGYVPYDRPVPNKFVGRPVPYYDVSLRDQDGEKVKKGTPGEICLRPSLPSILLNEYYKKPQETLISFNGLWYHTGDSGVEVNDGEYCFVDRISNFIRVKGENISSFQVEELVQSHPNIILAAATGVPAEEGEEDDLLLFIEVADSKLVDYRDLLSWFQENLPMFMQPKFVRICNEMPRTSTDKIQKHSLAKAFLDDAHPKHERIQLLEIPNKAN